MSLPSFSRGIRIWCIVGLILFGVMQAPPAVFAAVVDTRQSEKYFEAAKEYVANGDVNAAIIELKNALQKDADNVAARLLLGKIYLGLNNGPYAEKEIRAAQRRGANDLATRVMLARALLLQPNRFKDVLATLEEEVDNAALQPDILVLRGRALLGLRRFEEAEAAFLKADKLRPEGVQAKVGLAQGKVYRGDLPAAEKEVDIALSRDPKSVEALILKAELRRLARDLKGAVAQFDKAIALRPDNSLARLGRSASLIDLNRDDDARADLDYVSQRFPRHPLVAYLNALILAKKKDYTAAQDALQAVGSALDRHMPSVFLSGAIHYALGQLEQAIKRLDFYVAARPGNSRARKLLGAALVRKKEPRQAIEVLEPIAKRSDADAQVLTLIGSAYMQVGKFNEGAEYFSRAAEVAPDVASIQTRLALGNLARGKADDAVAQLERALDLNPDAGRAAMLLALVKLRKKDYDGALEAARKLRKAMPDNPIARNLEGTAQLQMGDIKAARKTFEDTLKTNPDFHPARMRLAQIARRDGKPELARTRYKEILDRDPKHMGAMAALSEMALAEKNSADAISWLQRAAEANPTAVMPRMRLIGLYGRLRQFNKALAVAQELDRNVPNNASALEVLGRAETAAGEVVSAAATFSRLAALRPKSARVLGLVAGAQIAAKDLAAGRDTLKRAMALDPKYLPVRIALIELESRDKNFNRAMKLATALRESQKKSPVGDMLVGDVLVRQKKFDDAVVAYEAGFAKAPGSALAIRRFKARRGAGQIDRALEELRGWVIANKDRAARHVLASAYIAANRIDNAIRETETLLFDDAQNAVLLNNLAWLYQQKGDSRAVEFAERALTRAPKSPAVMDTLGWILLDTGNSSRALDLLREANSLAPRHGDIRYHFAVALQRNGKTAEARRELQDLIDSQIKFSKIKEARALLKKLRGG
jgi:putative PEP-CTERM system TPR-repeat lipoprotein